MIDIVPWPCRFTVPLLKVKGYLLNPSSEDGASKSAYFSSYGFSPSDPTALQSALEAHARIERFASIRVGRWGMKYLFEGPLPAPNGRAATVRSVWQVREWSSGQALLVTAIPNGV